MAKGRAGETDRKMERKTYWELICVAGIIALSERQVVVDVRKVGLMTRRGRVLLRWVLEENWERSRFVEGRAR